MVVVGGGIDHARALLFRTQPPDDTPRTRIGVERAGRSGRRKTTLTVEASHTGVKGRVGRTKTMPLAVPQFQKERGEPRNPAPLVASRAGGGTEKSHRPVGEAA